jgi:MoaA/NifB/PqqE/SkfB family radical SAM enzyme
MSRLRLLVLAVSERCDQRCVHCQIHQGPPPGRTALTLAERLRVVDEALAEGAREALLTGGEPLLSPDLWPVAQRLKEGGARLMLATNGLRLVLHARDVARWFDELYVSLDGATAATHDAVRGAASFERVAAGVAAVKRERPELQVVARSTLHAQNLHEFEAVAPAARAAGFDHVSFLALDASSGAFGGDQAARRALVPAAGQVDALEASIRRLEASGAFSDGFILESPDKLRRLARHLRASGASLPYERPECDAPRWSSVVEADGTIRPCFFHAPLGHAREGLGAMRRSERFRSALRVIAGPNATCERCVCPKRRARSWLSRLTA